MNRPIENEVRMSHPTDTIKCDFERSRTAAIKLKCLTCSNNQRAEVRDCHLTDCPLWQVRPYQNEGEVFEAPIERSVLEGLKRTVPESTKNALVAARTARNSNKNED